MFGLIVGTLCLFALIATLRARRYAYYAPFGYWRHAYGHGHDYGYFHHGGGRRQRRRYAVRWMFEQLDTTPGQEKAILKSIEDLREQLSGSRGELHEARKELAQALGGDVLDQAALNAALSRVDGVVDRSRDEFVAAVTQIHAALDGKQRKQLAELIADFPSYRYGYGRC